MLRVSGDGLRTQAGWCESLVARLAGNSAPTKGMGSSALASGAAVNAAHALVAAAGIRCTSRVQSMATDLSAASDGYAENELRSAAEFRALGPVMEC